MVDRKNCFNKTVIIISNMAYDCKFNTFYDQIRHVTQQARPIEMILENKTFYFQDERIKFSVCKKKRYIVCKSIDKLTTN